jgi:O-acetylhomoserine (thiol)-lyase
MKACAGMKGFTSKILHFRDRKQDPYGGLRFPIYDCSSFEFYSADALAGAFNGNQPAHAYSRVSNPTVEAFECRVTEMAGAHNSIALASGMAAITSMILTLCEAGSTIVASKYLFGNTICLLQDTLGPWGLKIKWVDPSNCGEIAQAIDTTTRLVFIETISNPQIVIADVAAISKVCMSKKVPLVLDNSLATSCLLRSADHQVALEIVSSAKYISGGGTSIGGLIIDNGCFDWSLSPKLKRNFDRWGRDTFCKTIRMSVARNTGPCLSPHSAYLQMLGLETLPLRIERSSSNAKKVAEVLCAHQLIQKVNYPGIETSPFFSLSRKQFSSGLCGGLMSFDLADHISPAQFLDKLMMIKRSSNFNDNKSLVIHPASTLFCEYDTGQLENMGISKSTIRLSVGIEEVEDIIEDLEMALQE